MATLAKDPLTGAYRRDELMTYLQHFVSESERTEQPFSVVMLDIDHFKSLNDTFGHARGDSILRGVVERLQTAIRDEDLLFRYGGDEFVLLLPTSDKERATHVSGRLLSRVAGSPFAGDPALAVTLSIGTATFPVDGRTPEELFERADARLYLSKRHGRGRVTSHDVHLDDGLRFDEDGRLLERDAALAQARNFLERVPQQGRGVLIVTGPAGAGHSRFLREVARQAALQGFAHLAVRGTPTRRERYLGALHEAHLDGRSLPDTDAGSLLALIQAAADRSRQEGLLLTIEGVMDLDLGSRRLLKQLLDSDLGILGVAYADPSNSGTFGREIPFRQQVTLNPLSRSAIALWLRHALGHEPNEPTLTLLHDATGGLPGLLRDALQVLETEGRLTPSPDGWHLDDLDEGELRRLLERRRSPPPHLLPNWSSPLVGRHEAIKEITAALEESRLVTLLGPGGIGKSRLACQVGREQLYAFPDGVYFVPLAEVANGDGLLGAIARTLQLSGGDDPLEQLAGSLRDKRLLLILDNVEHLLEASGTVAALLEQIPSLSLLLTSREPLRHPLERTVLLEGLSLPAAADLPGFENYAAVQLFLQQAEHAGAEIGLTQEQKRYLFDICRITGGIPLALELAAAWTPVLEPRQIAARLAGESHPDDVLGPQPAPAQPSAGVAGRPERLHQVLDSFWTLLSPSEQEMLAGLALFRNGFRADAAHEITGASLFFLLGLVDRSFLRLSAERYHMHELLRQYAEQQLPPDDALKRRHAHYYRRLAVHHGQAQGDSRTIDAYRVVDAEFENFRIAWRYGVEQRDVTLLEPLARLLRGYLDVRGRTRDGIALFEAAAEALSNDTPGRQADPAPDPALDRPNSNEAALATERTLAWLHESLALFYFHRNDLATAERLARQALQRQRRLGSSDGLAIALNTFGMITATRGDPRRGLAYFREALAVYRSLGDRVGEAKMLGNIAIATDQLGDHAQAKEAFRASIELHRELRNSSSVAVELISLADLHLALGELEQAEATYHEAHALGEDVGYRLVTALALSGLGQIHAARKRHHAAASNFTAALSLFERLEHRGRIAWAHARLARCQLLLEQPQAAERHLRKALRLAHEERSEALARFALGVLALLHAAHDRKQAAARLLGTLRGIAVPAERYPEELHDDLIALEAKLERELSDAVWRRALAEGVKLGPKNLLTEALEPAVA